MGVSTVFDMLFLWGGLLTPGFLRAGGESPRQSFRRSKLCIILATPGRVAKY
jgi:hypothetical protein